MKIKAYLIGGKVTSNSKAAFDLFASQQFGEKSSDKILYSLSETLFLLKSGKLELFDYTNKGLSIEDVEGKFYRLDRSFDINFLVFSDLRKKGYIVKSALKFGAEFRVYEKGKKAGKNHAKWIVFPVTQKDKCKWQVFVSHNRVAHSTKKKVLFAVVDNEHKVTYFETSWVRP